MTAPRLAVGGATVDLEAGVVRGADGRETVLRPKTAEVLRALAAKPGEVVSKEALFEAVWPGLAVVEDSLVQCVGEIRAALGEADRGALRTLPKRGYALEVAEAAAAPSEAAASATPVAPAARARRFWAATALAAAALVAAGLALRPEPAPAPAGFTQAVAKETAAVDALHASVLVLPFEDRSEAGDLGHFADGMTEDLIAELSRWREVRVVARMSADTFKGRTVDARQAAAEMGVRYVLDGSVRRVGDRLRVTAQLVDGASGRSLWAERFDETGADVLALQEAVISRLLQTLTGTHGAITRNDTARAWAKAAVDLDEYDYYLRGHDLFYRYTREDMAQAIAVWREGRRKFPRSGLLAIKEGWGHMLNAQYGWAEDPAAAFAEAARLAEEGLRDPALPAAGHRFGLWLQVYADVFHRRDYAAATRHARAVVEAFPYDPEGLFWMADMMNYAGEPDLARRWVTTALARDRNPIDAALAVAIDLAWLDGRFEDAVGFGDRLEAVDILTAPTLGASLVALGRLDEARALLDRFGRDFPAYTPDALRAGRPYRDPAVAERLLARLAEAGWPPATD